MAKLDILKGAVDVTLYIKILDSSSTIGAGLTGLAHNSSGLTCYYVRPLGSATQLTLATQTVTGAHSDGGFVEVSASNMPGVYRLDLSDAIVASGVNSVLIQLKGATNMVPVELEIELTSYNPYDAVRMGMTALPNAAAEAAGGLYTRGSGAGQINQPANGQIDVNVEKWNATDVPAEHSAGYPITTIKDGTGTGELDTASGVVLAKDHSGANLATAAALDAVDNFIDTEIAAMPASVNTTLSAAHGSGLWGGAGGAGSISWPITITVNGSPVDGVSVWVTTDVAGTNVVASGITNGVGIVTFLLDAGTYYAWKQHAGYNFTNPESFTVS